MRTRFLYLLYNTVQLIHNLCFQVKITSGWLQKYAVLVCSWWAWMVMRPFWLTSSSVAGRRNMKEKTYPNLVVASDIYCYFISFRHQTLDLNTSESLFTSERHLPSMSFKWVVFINRLKKLKYFRCRVSSWRVSWKHLFDYGYLEKEIKCH